MKAARIVLALLMVVGVASLASAGPVTINFDDLADGEFVTTQYQYLGVTFSSGTALTAGISLNEFEFPPHSDSNVVFDDGGAISLLFGAPMASFGAYFTYGAPLTVYAYDASDNLLTSIASAFASNLWESGDLGSTPNEFLQLVWAPGITRVVIEGDTGGTSFVMDDVTATPVPEPGSTLLLLSMGGAGLTLMRTRLRRRA